MYESERMILYVYSLFTVGAEAKVLVRKATASYLPFVTASSVTPFKHNPSIKVHTQLTRPSGMYKHQHYSHTHARLLLSHSRAPATLAS
jgi:hypothetical protein